MAIPFEQAGSTNRGVIVFRGRGSKTLAHIEDLLARATNVRDVRPEAVASICAERQVDLRNRLARGRRQLYGRYLRHCFEDRQLTDGERADLAHLRELLHLSNVELAAIHDQVALEVYGEVVQEVLADFQIDDDEAAFLQQLRDDLGLDEDEAARILEEKSSDARIHARSQAEVRDRQFVEQRSPAGEFAGRSETSLEHAIQDAIAKASLAVPTLHWFEVIDIAGYVASGRPSGWHVTVRAGIHKSEIEAGRSTGI